MEKKASKKEIWEASVKAQQAIIDDLHNRVEELKATGQQYADEQQDSGARSMTEGTEEQAALMSEQLAMVVEEMEKLQRIDTASKHENVHLGTVVVTAQQRFFISVSVERFKVQGVEYFGVSTQSPLYKALEGKVLGDTVAVNNHSFKILDLY
jgi:transcription elongation GreA/GreB family factor